MSRGAGKKFGDGEIDAATTVETNEEGLQRWVLKGLGPREIVSDWFNPAEVKKPAAMRMEWYGACRNQISADVQAAEDERAAKRRARKEGQTRLQKDTPEEVPMPADDPEAMAKSQLAELQRRLEVIQRSIRKWERVVEALSEE
jgi:hypothetical protein